MAKKYECYDKIMCRIKIRPTFRGRKEKPKVQELNGQVLLMQVLWLQEDEDNYPGEYALKPYDEDTWFKWSEENDVGWISSGDVEILESCHSEEVCKRITDTEVFDNGFIVIRKKALELYIKNMVEQGTETLVIDGDGFSFAAYNRVLNLAEIEYIAGNMDETNEMRIKWREK